MFFFCCLGGGPGPAQTAKKKHAPAQTAKKKTRPRPFRACCFFCCLGGWVCLFFCCSGGVFFFLLFGRGRVLFLLFGRGRVLFLLFGPGACFFLLFGRGTGVHSLTRLPGSSLSDPTTKETEQQKKNTGSIKYYSSGCKESQAFKTYGNTTFRMAMATGWLRRTVMVGRALDSSGLRVFWTRRFRNLLAAIEQCCCGCCKCPRSCRYPTRTGA